MIGRAVALRMYSYLLLYLYLILHLYLNCESCDLVIGRAVATAMASGREVAISGVEMTISPARAAERSGGSERTGGADGDRSLSRGR